MSPRHGSSEPLVSGIFTHQAADPTPESRAVGKSEERLRQAVRVAELGIFEHDHRSNELYWSPKQREIFGFGPDEATSLEAFLATVHPDDIAFVTEAVRQALTPLGDGRYDIEHRIVRRDGEVRWLLARAQTLFAHDGSECRPVRTVGALVDVTERKIAEEERKRTETALRASERRFRALLEKNQELIALVNARGVLEFVSPAATTILGYEPHELVGKRVSEWIHPDDREAAVRALSGLDSPGAEAAPLVLRTRHRDGKYRLLESHLRNLLAEEAVQAMVINARDVTERLHLEERYREVQKLDSLGRLAGGIAHDFNNMLTGILGYAELLESGLKKGRMPGGELAEIVRAANRARELTQQLLAFARRQAHTPRVVDLTEVVNDAERFLQRVLGEGIDLRISRGKGPHPVLIDPARLEQVIMNLALNARDAMDGQGVLRLETRTRFVEAGMLPELEPGEYVVLSVIDHGSGISSEHLAHLFEPFFTTKPVGSGTGLGLATVYGIVRQSNGHVQVCSELGVGTEFHVYFPRAPAPVSEQHVFTGPA